jgi:hypothetical protein
VKIPREENEKADHLAWLASADNSDNVGGRKRSSIVWKREFYHLRRSQLFT